MIFVFLGPPGAGKGTQARLLLQDFSNMVQLSTGDMLREAVASGSRIGEEVATLIQSGQLVPDHVVVDLIRQNLENLESGVDVILDGFPRNVAQAKSLDVILSCLHRPLTAAISLEVDDAILVERVAGRFTCVKCGEGYHDHYKIPSREGICDQCGGKEFLRRQDDTALAVKTRLDSYHEQTKPLLDFYNSRALLHEVYGLAEIQSVFSEIKSIINSMQRLTS